MAANAFLISVIGKSLEKVSEETIKHAGPGFAAGILTAPFDGLSVTVLSHVVPAMVAAIVEAIGKSERIEQKLDALIEAPLATAATIVDTVLRANWQTEEQKQERSRMLKLASDRLFDAYGNADKVRPDLTAPIRALQAVIFALRPEAQPMFENVVRELSGMAAGLRVQAQDALERAEGLGSEEFYAAAFRGVGGVDPYQIAGQIAMAIPMAQENLQNEAKEATERANEIDRFCSFLLSIARGRDAFFQTAMTKS